MLCKRNILVILQLLTIVPIVHNELWTKAKTKVNANAVRPFLHIEQHKSTKLLITQRRQPYYLACNATIEPSYYQSDTQYYFTWFRNHNSLPLNDFVIYKNGTLRLPPKKKAAGVYRCKINADTNAIISESITVEYPVLRRFHSSENYKISVGMTLTLNCPVQSIPPANITWYYGNVSLLKIFKENSYIILSNGSLVLRNIEHSKSGKFKCVAYNLYALKAHHRQFVLPVHVLDMNTTEHIPGEKARNSSYLLIPPLQDSLLYVPLNGDLNLTCYASSDNIAIEWWFQHNLTSPLVKLLNNSREYHIRSSIEQYEGNYTCRTAFDEQTFHVIVTKPPVILKDLPVDEANIASSKTFTCLAGGNPPPTITWYHNGEELNSSYTRYINAHQLHIPSFDPDESGIYQCFARNIVGEVYTTGELRLKNQSEIIANPLKNIKCYPHTFNSINVTFDNQASESLYIVYLVHIGLSEPFRWMSPYPPMKLNASYVIIELPHIENLPYVKPFQIITRVLIPTSDMRMANKPTQKTVLSTLRSLPITCCTQGLPSRFVHIANDTFVTWSVPDLSTKKYFIIQFAINETIPNPENLSQQPLSGTLQHINLTQEDIIRKLQPIEAINFTETKKILKNALSNYNNYYDNDVHNAPLRGAVDIFSLVIPAHITGILLRNFTKLKLRVLVITTENENLAQDYRYVEWKMMENSSNVIWTAPYRLTIIESRMLRFHFDNNLSERCVLVCYVEIHYPRLRRGERKCEQRNISGHNQSQLEIRTLKPTTHYSLHFSSCDAKIFYGQYDVVTLPDPPGPISNQRVTRHNGLKLSWDPPLQQNGKIHYYNILWSLGNITHEANIFECSVCFYKFPNISETAKINISIRVVGETGIGAPIYIDLRNIDHRSLKNEISNVNYDIYIGVTIGVLLSILCILAFTVLIIMQRKRFVNRQLVSAHLRTLTDINFGNFNNIGTIVDRSGGGTNPTNVPHECHEMQTLIPRLTEHSLNIRSNSSLEYENVYDLSNGHAITTTKTQNTNTITDTHIIDTILSEFEMISDHKLLVVPLYKTSPPHKCKQLLMSKELHSKPFFIPFKNSSAQVMAIQKQAQERHNKRNSSSYVVNVPPRSLPLTISPLEMSVFGANGYGGTVGAYRSNSLSSSSNGSSASSSYKHKQFYTNFPKHAKSTDGICLLAEDDLTSTITPTLDMNINVELFNNDLSALHQNACENAENRSVKETTVHQLQSNKSYLENQNSNILQQQVPINIFTRTTVSKPSSTATVIFATKNIFSTSTALQNHKDHSDLCSADQVKTLKTAALSNTIATENENDAIVMVSSSKLQDIRYNQPDMDPNG